MTSHYNVEKDQKANDWALGDTLGNMAANKTLYIYTFLNHMQVKPEYDLL